MSAFFFCWLLLVWGIFGYTPTNDGGGYLELANMSIADGQPYPTLTHYKYDALPFVWNIGIINLTACILTIFGTITPLFPLLCLLKALTAWLIAQTTKILFSERVAIIALLLYMFYPNNWGQSTMISSEIPADCLMMLAVWILVRVGEQLQQNKLTTSLVRQIIAGGFIIGFSNWFRPTAMIFIVVLSLWYIYILRKQAWKPVLAVLTGYCCFILIVGSSTYLRTGHFVYQARSLWFSMIDECYDGAKVAPHWNQPIWPEGYPRYIGNHEQLDCFECERIWKERSIEWLKKHPMDYLMKVPGRIYYMYQSDYDYLTAFLSNKEHSENNYIILPYRHLLTDISSLNPIQWFALFCMLCYGCLLIGFILGTYLLIKQKQYKSLFLPLFIIVGGTFMLTLVMHGETRFKTPLMPYFFMLTAVWLSTLLSPNSTFVSE